MFHYRFILILAIVGIVLSSNGEDFITFSQKQRIAIRSEKWYDAIAETIGIINQTKDNNISASSFLQLGVLLWLSGNQSKAVSAINRSIHIMRFSSNVDTSMVISAKKILSRLRKSNTPPNQQEKSALIHYIITLNNSVTNFHGDVESEKRYQEEIRRHNLLMRHYDSEISRLKQEAKRFERESKRKADREYWEATKKTFDPEQRPQGRATREQWDAAKRIYDIFDK